MTKRQRIANVRRELRALGVRGDALQLARFMREVRDSDRAVFENEIKQAFALARQPGLSEQEEFIFFNLIRCSFHANNAYAGYVRQFRRPKADRIRAQYNRLIANGLRLRRDLVVTAMTIAMEFGRLARPEFDVTMLKDIRSIAVAVDGILQNTRLFAA